MNIPAVHITDLKFGYPASSKAIFAGLALDVQQGERFGLFGPNGAGKTTLMGLMTGLITAGSGSIELLGKPVAADKSAKKLFGFVPQDFSFYHELSPVENMAFFGAWAGLDQPTIRKRTNELLDILGLADVKHKQVRQFSGGMKRRVNLAIGVIHHPKILFLDEPTVGVDVQTRHAILNYLLQLNKEGTTLVYTSHQLNEAQELCNRLALIDEGRIIANGEMQQLLTDYQQPGLEGLFLSLTGRAYRD